MKISNQLERAVYVTAILALQKDHEPVKSQVLSQVLKVSDSYLKKMLMKLSKAGIVTSNASKVGGYQLAQSVEQITLKDLFFALELNEGIIEIQYLAERIFEDKEHAKSSQKKVEQTLQQGLGDFYERLNQLTISEILKKEAYKNGAIDWKEIADDFN